MLTATSAGDPGRPQSRARTLVRRALVGATSPPQTSSMVMRRWGWRESVLKRACGRGAGMHTTFCSAETSVEQ